MKNIGYFIALLFVLTAPVIGQQRIAEIGDLQLENGEVIKNCTIGYSALGSSNSAKSNIILYPTWFGGISSEIEHLIKKYDFLDTNRYQIIIVDALGNGVSSSPSNSKYQPGEKFPQFSIRDMVNSQHLLLTKIFNLTKIYAAVGGSMGSFQLFEWSVAYPGFIEKMVPYVCTPRLNSYEMLYMKTRIDMIETGRKFGIPDEKINEILSEMTALTAKTPDYIIENVDRSGFDEYWSNFKNKNSSPFTVDSRLFQLRAMLSFDISKYFGGSLKKAAEANKSKMLIVVSRNDLIVPPAEAIKFAEYSNSELLILDNNCGHIILICDMEKVKERIRSFLNNNYD